MASMLHEFLIAHRHDLIRRCVRKANERGFPLVASSQLEYGVPVFPAQLVEALRPQTAGGAARRRRSDPAPAESSRTAALHGKALLEHGCTVAELVHGYGDICQAITELAKEKSAPVTVDEFHTLNRLLDNAIADAVASYGRYREATSVQSAREMQQRMETLVEKERELVRTALKALDAVRLGNLGLMGATGGLLEDSLKRLRDLVDKALPEIRLSAGMTTPPKRYDGEERRA